MAGFRSLLIYALLALLFVSFMGAGIAVAPPPLRATNSADAFDANAAHARLVRILGDETPHPVDSAAQDAVRERLLIEIRALGFTPDLRDEFACRPNQSRPQIDCARVRNIIFQAGPQDGPAVLAAAHYDSVPAAPGAADDGLGTSVLLEIARLVRDQPLQRRIIFLISDGEEPGLLGAHVFASDPLMQSVEALVNVEARGTRGPAVFFETNRPNADAIAAFAGAPHGIANSVMAAVYALLPNSTDVSALTRPDLDIVNLALLDGLEDYHTPQDSLASLDPASLQHAGDIALHTVRAFASSADRDDAADYVYTDIAARAFVSAPQLSAQIALGVALLIAAAAFWRAGREGRWLAFAAPPLALILAGVLAAGAGFALSLLRPGEAYAFAHPEPTRAWCILIALVAALLALILARASRAPALAEASAMLWFTLLGFATTFLLGGITILYALPAVAYALGCLVALVWKAAQAIGAAIAALVALVVWAPALYLTELGLGFEYPFATAALYAIVILTWFGLLARANGGATWRIPAAVTGAAALAAIGAAYLAPSSSAARPLPLNISYFLDADANTAHVIAGTAERALPPGFDGFTAAFLLPGDTSETWMAPAAVHPAPTPRLTELTPTEGVDERTLNARIAANGAARIILRIPRAAQAVRASLNGVAVAFTEPGEGDDFATLVCNGRSCDGASLELTFAIAGEPGDILIAGQTPGFTSPESIALIARRPADRTAIQQGDAAFVVSTVRP